MASGAHRHYIESMLFIISMMMVVVLCAVAALDTKERTRGRDFTISYGITNRAARSVAFGITQVRCTATSRMGGVSTLPAMALATDVVTAVNVAPGNTKFVC